MRIRLTPEAKADLSQIRAWRKKNCGGGAGPFSREYRAALNRLRRLPYSGHPCRDPNAPPGTLQELLRDTQHYIYYVVDEAQRAVIILTVWANPRGEGPF